MSIIIDELVDGSLIIENPCISENEFSDNNIKYINTFDYTFEDLFIHFSVVELRAVKQNNQYLITDLVIASGSSESQLSALIAPLLSHSKYGNIRILQSAKRKYVYVVATPYQDIFEDEETFTKYIEKYKNNLIFFINVRPIRKFLFIKYTTSQDPYYFIPHKIINITKHYKVTFTPIIFEDKFSEFSMYISDLLDSVNSQHIHMYNKVNVKVK